MKGTDEGPKASKSQDGNGQSVSVASTGNGNGQKPPQPKWSDPEDPRSANIENGKIPEDIPSAENDSVLEAQIRQAAINETDPELQARLWNEYRKYKGLPQVE